MSETVERFLNQLHHPALAGIDLSLERMHRFLGLLGMPQKRMPPVIHVAGTNGKGSLLAYLMAIFEAAGYRVHRYISPHLVRFHERITIAGKTISDRDLESVLKHAASVLPMQQATFFEATTAAAFLAFAEHKADIVLLETGLGGRLDATNVIDKPLVTTITPISMDHQQYLGNTIEAITREKAGIMKRGVTCVVGRQTEIVSKELEKHAAAAGAPLARLGNEWNWGMENGQAVYRSPGRELAFSPSLAGKYQYDNAATAIACIEQAAGFNINDAHIAEGIACASWPGRLQRLLQGTYAKLLPPGMELWLDGGHNPQGGQVLAEWLATQSGREIHLVCGMMQRKDSLEYLAHLKPYVKELHAIQIPREPQAQTAESVRTAAEKAGIPAVTAPDAEKALQTIAERAKTPATICICGSLYLAGKVLAANGG
jgi:dihydrofolate synthase / folylpolyglutamate synthase